jgi:hypothetical protein
VDIRNRPIQHVFYKGAEPAIRASADKEELLTGSQQRSHMFIPIFDDALPGRFYPAAKAAGARAYLPIVFYNGTLSCAEGRGEFRICDHQFHKKPSRHFPSIFITNRPIPLEL